MQNPANETATIAAVEDKGFAALLIELDGDATHPRGLQSP
jgi:hypothetical protein